MSVEFDRETPGKFDSRTLSKETLSRWTGRNLLCVVPISSDDPRRESNFDPMYIYIYIYTPIYLSRWTAY